MKKNTPPLRNTKKDFDKVFENPLDWCPIFGYLPDVEEYNVCEDKTILDLVGSCLDIINDCRNNFGFDYRPYLHMKKYLRLPELEKTLPRADDDYINYLESLRRIFRNLDFLSIKTASLCDHNDALVNAINISYKTISIETTFPQKPIGRVSNLHNDGLSAIAEDIRLDRVYWRDSILLEEARKLSGDAAKLDNIKLISLYTILEVWLVVTRLLLKPKHEKDSLLFHMEKLAYAKELKNIAEDHSNLRHISSLYNENMTLADNNKELNDEIEVVKGMAIPLMEEKKKRKERMIIARAQREQQNSIMHLAVNKLKKDYAKHNNADGLYRHVFKSFSVTDDLILRLCGNDETALKHFYQVEDNSDEYHFFILPDVVDPEEHSRARLGYVKNRDPNNKHDIAFSTFRSEYFYKHKKRNRIHKGGKKK